MPSFQLIQNLNEFCVLASDLFVYLDLLQLKLFLQELPLRLFDFYPLLLAFLLGQLVILLRLANLQRLCLLLLQNLLDSRLETSLILLIELSMKLCQVLFDTALLLL